MYRCCKAASTPGIHTRFQEILPDFKVAPHRNLSQLGTMPSKKKHQATDNIACPKNSFNFIHGNPAAHAG